MIGLLWKDILNLKQQWVIYGILVVFWSIISVTTESGTSLFACIAVLAALTPISAAAYDERTKWNMYALTTPVSRCDLVLSKYVLGWLASGCIIVLITLEAVVMKIDGAQTMKMIPLVLDVMLICMAFELPLQFKFGSEKGRLISLVVFMVPVLAAVGMGTVADSEQAFEILMGAELTAGFAGLAVALIIQVLSIWLSVRIYKKKDF